MSIWGSPGFGKTSVATEVGHQLQTGGLPVYFFSMRGLLSKADLTMSEDELPLFLGEISDDFVMILDNADELLESGAPNVKEDFINLLEDILGQFKNLTFLTTRESLEYINVHFEGHQAVRIGPLHESFAQTLVGGLLPEATASDCSKIAKICGFVPLAMKLLCSSFTEDNAQLSQFLDGFEEFIESNIFELLDNPDYPSNLRLKLLFESSFQRLSLYQRKKRWYHLVFFLEIFTTQSLLESCSDPETCDVAFSVLTKAEFFLDSLFWCEGKIIDKIYDHATKEAQAFGKSVFYSQLLVSLAFGEVTWGTHGRSLLGK